MNSVKDTKLTPEIIRKIAFAVKDNDHYLFPISENLLQYLVLSWENDKKQFIASLMDKHRTMGQDEDVFVILSRPVKLLHELQELFFGLCRQELKISSIR